MCNENNVLSERINQAKSTVEQDKNRRASKYNYCVMKSETIEAKQGFSKRLVQLREARRVSGRAMSLSLGQGAGYVNNIECGKNLPSMAMFFEICEYLNVSPEEFFSYSGMRSSVEIAMIADTLSSEDQDLLLEIVERLRK